MLGGNLKSRWGGMDIVGGGLSFLLSCTKDRKGHFYFYFPPVFITFHEGQVCLLFVWFF